MEDAFEVELTLLCSPLGFLMNIELWLFVSRNTLFLVLNATHTHLSRKTGGGGASGGGGETLCLLGKDKSFKNP